MWCVFTIQFNKNVSLSLLVITPTRAKHQQGQDISATNVEYYHLGCDGIKSITALVVMPCTGLAALAGIPSIERIQLHDIFK